MKKIVIILIGLFSFACHAGKHLPQTSTAAVTAVKGYALLHSISPRGRYGCLTIENDEDCENNLYALQPEDETVQADFATQILIAVWSNTNEEMSVQINKVEIVATGINVYSTEAEVQNEVAKSLALIAIPRQHARGNICFYVNKVLIKTIRLKDSQTAAGNKAVSEPNGLKKIRRPAVV